MRPAHTSMPSHALSAWVEPCSGRIAEIPAMQWAHRSAMHPAHSSHAFSAYRGRKATGTQPCIQRMAAMHLRGLTRNFVSRRGGFGGCPSTAEAGNLAWLFGPGRECQIKSLARVQTVPLPDTFFQMSPITVFQKSKGWGPGGGDGVSQHLTRCEQKCN